MSDQQIEKNNMFLFQTLLFLKNSLLFGFHEISLLLKCIHWWFIVILSYLFVRLIEMLKNIHSNILYVEVYFLFKEFQTESLSKSEDMSY